MNGLQSALNQFLGGRRPKRVPKSQLYAVYPNGQETKVTRKGKWWMWSGPGNAGEWGSSHLDQVRYQVEELGGRLERRPID